MQNKGVIRLFAILLALACVYYFSFTYFSAKTEDAAKDYAQSYIQRTGVQKLADKLTNGDTAAKASIIDSLEGLANDGI